MYLSFSIYIIASIAAISNCEAEDNLSVLSLPGSTAATHHLRRSDLIAGQEEESMKQKAQRTLNVAGTGLFKTVSRVLEEDCCCCCDNDNNAGDDTDVGDNNVDDTGADDTDGNSPPSGTTSSPTPVPTISLNPTYVEKKLVASDGVGGDTFATTCSVTTDFAVLGAIGVDSSTGAAYVFRLDGTELSKITPSQFLRDDDGANALFGVSVSIDEKVVVASMQNYIAIFSLEGIFEKYIYSFESDRSLDERKMADTIFGQTVATYGDKIVTFGDERGRGFILYIYTTAGDVLQEILVGDRENIDLAVQSIDISAQYIVTTGRQTTVYMNEAPEFPEISKFVNAGFGNGRTAKDTMIEPRVAVAGERIVLGERTMNNNDGAAWLYEIDGTLITELDRQDSASGSWFGRAVGITDEKVFVGAPMDNGGLGFVFVYSAATGDFIEKIASPDGVAGGFFGSCMDFSDNSDIIGAAGEGGFTGAAYVKNFPS